MIAWTAKQPVTPAAELVEEVRARAEAARRQGEMKTIGWLIVGIWAILLALAAFYGGGFEAGAP
jgi:hypothetical protein